LRTFVVELRISRREVRTFVVEPRTLVAEPRTGVPALSAS